MVKASGHICQGWGLWPSWTGGCSEVGAASLLGVSLPGQQLLPSLADMQWWPSGPMVLDMPYGPVACTQSPRVPGPLTRQLGPRQAA